MYGYPAEPGNYQLPHCHTNSHLDRLIFFLFLILFVFKKKCYNRSFVMTILKTSDDRPGKWELNLGAKFSLLWGEVFDFIRVFFTKANTQKNPQMIFNFSEIFSSRSPGYGELFKR